MLNELRPHLRHNKFDTGAFSTRADFFSSKVNLCREKDSVEQLFTCNFEYFYKKIDGRIDRLSKINAK